ncbi:hypothetical protein KOW79_015080 [Hemibagrus wyckioides]|uniref:SHSP domain-containing protein n=1 Tax=Hemibagrus wyckioides TaxID=337641 RepID=A0A9D3SFD8_9TELE|nr:hypothetical protein KOW79_015080 [Hemibagrus wyckioides]
MYGDRKSTIQTHNAQGQGLNQTHKVLQLQQSNFWFIQHNVFSDQLFFLSLVLFFIPFISKVQLQRGDSESFISERETFGSCQGDKKSHTGGYQGDWSHGDTHGAIWVDDHYYTSADVSRFEPHDIVVMAFNSSIVIHAEKVGDDGCVMDRFTHKSLLPEDMDPLSVSGTLTPEGVLVISVKSLSRSSSYP